MRRIAAGVGWNAGKCNKIRRSSGVKGTAQEGNVEVEAGTNLVNVLPCALDTDTESLL